MAGADGIMAMYDDYYTVGKVSEKREIIREKPNAGSSAPDLLQ